jgi:uncharacterized protein (DUF983 family)
VRPTTAAEPLEPRRPSARTALLLALRGRCPHCGQGRLGRSWFITEARCARCGLRFDRSREEEHEYWLGAFTLNFIVTEVVFAMALFIALLVTWPTPPWTLLLVGGGVLMIATPIVFYPYARALWLAIDLVFRPPQPEDFEC